MSVRPTRCRCGTRLARDHDGTLCSRCQREAVHPPDVPRDFWEFKPLRDALNAWHMGHVISAYRRHPYHGRHQLPQRAMAGWLGVTQAHLSRIETGPPIKDLDRLIPWARILKIPENLLWFKLPAETATPSKMPAVRLKQRTSTPSGHSTTARLPAADHALPINGDSDESAMQSFRVADRQVGGGHMYAAVVRYLQAEISPRLFGNIGDGSRGRAFSAGAALTEMAAWMAHDAGQDALAKQHFSRSLELANTGDDRQLCAHILASMSHLANHLQQPTQAIDLARAGIAELSSGPKAPEIEARLLTMEARGLAAQGESKQCAELLTRAEGALDQTSAIEPSVWVSGFDQGALASETGRCLQQLGDLSQARKQAEIIVALRPADRVRSRAFGQLVLATTLAQQGELDEACDIGYEVVDSTRMLGSYLVIQQLGSFQATLKQHRSSDIVNDFLGYLSKALRTRMRDYRWLNVEPGGFGQGMKARW